MESLSCLNASCGLLAAACEGLIFLGGDLLNDKGWLLRPTLTASWGVALGSSVWVMFVQKRGNGKEQGERFTSYYALNTAATSLLAVATAGLARNNKVLMAASQASLLSFAACALYLTPKTIKWFAKMHAEEDKAGEQFTKLRRRALAYHLAALGVTAIAIIGLVPYVFH